MFTFDSPAANYINFPWWKIGNVKSSRQAKLKVYFLFVNRNPTPIFKTVLKSNADEYSSWLYYNKKNL